MSHKVPKWQRALVTGASRGIGAAITRRLAAKRVDLVLVARDRASLDLIAQECTEKFGVRVEVLDADLTTTEGMARVEARLSAEPRIDLLVNNAGTAQMGAFARLPIDEGAAMVELNVMALMRLSHAAVASMQRSGGGGVVNISSLAGAQPAPRMAAYGATKAFVNSFSEALYEEVRGTGVTVTAVRSGFVRTDLSAGAVELRKMPSAIWLTPDAVAQAALDGAARGRLWVVPSARYKVISAVSGLTPRSVQRRSMGSAARWAARLFDGEQVVQIEPGAESTVISAT
jgi:short-subunit dehydrogenase